MAASVSEKREGYTVDDLSSYVTVIGALDYSTTPPTVRAFNYAGSSPFSALTPSAPAATSVGIASASALVANANRKGLEVINTSANVISLAFGAPAVLYSGITIVPYGSWSMNQYNFNLLELFAIASGASSNLAIQEYA